MKEKDYCEKCPMYWQGCDYWGEWDEGCELWKDGWFNGIYDLFCKLPIFIKNIYRKYDHWKYLKYMEKSLKQQEEEESEG